MLLVLDLFTKCDENKIEKLLSTKILIQPWIEIRPSDFSAATITTTSWHLIINHFYVLVDMNNCCISRNESIYCRHRIFFRDNLKSVQM